MNNSLDRLLLGIMSLGYLAAALFLIVVALGWAAPVLLLENYLLYSTGRWVMGLTGAIVFLLSLTVFLSSLKTKQDQQAALHETSLGQIRITLPALEHLVTKAAKSVQGVREVRPLLKTSPAGLVVQLKVQIMPDVSIPNVTAELQKTIKEYMHKTAGIVVQEIKVLVNKVSWDTKSRVE